MRQMPPMIVVFEVLRSHGFNMAQRAQTAPNRGQTSNSAWTRNRYYNNFQLVIIAFSFYDNFISVSVV